MEQLQKDTEALTILKYFSIFRHPLKFGEILKLSGNQESAASLALYLNELVTIGTVQKIGDFYLHGGSEKDIEKRLAGEARAAQVLPQAKKMGRIIAAFPFVRFVGISGSLSKGYAGDKTDFDFFIITAHNALWICRSLLHLVKKMSFLVGKQHWMCMNYFIDEHALELEERNLFTQVELSTLIPVYNEPMYRLLLLKNKANLPNFDHLQLISQEPRQQEQLEYYEERYKKETNKWWRPLNLLLMSWTNSKWRRKWKKKGYPMEDYPLAFKTTPYISKNHPKNYQKTILQQLRKHQP
jgi:hypothetical protein